MSDAMSWPDEGCWELEPEAADARRASENPDNDWDHEGPTPDEVLDREAEDDVIA